MKKSREFDNVLDECLERLLVKGETIEECLGRFPEHTDALKPLLETALSVKGASAILPRSEFRDKARHQLNAAFQEVESKRRRSFFSWNWQPRWAMAVAVVLALLLAGSGTVVAASGSMPDEPLYPVKLATERVQLFFTPSALGKAELYAKLVDRRVSEIARMADKSKPEKIERATKRLGAYLAEIADLVSPQEVTAGVAMAPEVEEALVAEDAPAAEEALVAEEVPAAEEAPVLLERGKLERGKEVQVVRVGVDRRARLRATMERYAINNPARLRALLQTVPQSVKPALRGAIDVSESGYEKALESLD